MSYSSEVLADSPLAYWKLDETSGTTAADSSGNARDATYTGSPTVGATSLLADGSGKAMGLAADSGQHATIASASWMNVNTFTVEALATFSAYDSGNGDIVLSRYTAGDNYPMEMGRQYGGTAYPWIQVVVAGNRYNVAGPSALSNGVTYHLAATYDGSNIRMYVNGSQVGSPQAATGSVSWSSSQFDIGRSAQASTTVPGAVIDEVAFYGTALSGARIAAHAAAASAIPGSLAATLPGVATALAGTYAAPPSGALSATLPKVTASLVGDYSDPPNPVGELDAVLPKLTTSLAGDYTAPPPETGSLDAVLPFFTVAFEGIYSGPVPTDTSNAFDGLSVTCTAEVTITEAVVSSPSGTTRVDKAVPLPLPVLVKGRPT